MGIVTPQDALDFFQVRGYSPEASAGIVGNLVYESGWNPGAIGDSGSAYGLGQWHPDRQADFASVFGSPMQGSSIEQQLAFVDWELRNRSYFGFDALMRSPGADQATSVFMQNYERPASMASLDERQGIADKLLSGAKGVLNSSLAKDAIDAGISAVTGGANIWLPGAGDVLGGVLGGAANAVGIGGESCGIVCQIKEWLKSSGFFSRLALAVFAFIVLFAAFYLMKPNLIEAASKRLAKGK